MKHIKFIFLSILSLVFLQSCVSKKEMLYIQDIESYNNTEIVYSNHTIQVDDILKISVDALIPEAAFPYNDFSPTTVVANTIELLKLDGYLVSEDMTINFPVLGNLSVKGKTTNTLEIEIKKLLEDGGYLIEPNVAVRLVNAKVTILGEVKMPGTFSFTENNISFLQALGLAGDLTINGNREDIVVLRYIDGVQTIGHINLTSASFLSGPYQIIKPNDVIMVNPNGSKIKSSAFFGSSSSFVAIASLLISTVVLINSFN